MGPVTVVFGILLILLGLAGYLPHQSSYTALIPTGFGLVFVLLGLLARQDRWRMHVMHLAAVLGLVGLVGSAVRVVSGLAGGAEHPFALAMQGLMAVGCLVYLALCVKSFVDARRRRQAPPGERPA